jgi:tripartite-type tricarboxylate transporter receptor subunit TctC
MTAGGGRVIQNDMYKTIKPDGLNLLLTNGGAIWPPYMLDHEGVEYDITKFEYIAGLEKGNAFLCVAPKGKYTTVDALLKGKGLKFAISELGSMLALANLLAIEYLGLDGMCISGFANNAARQLAVQQGEIDGIVSSPDQAMLLLKSGTLVPLFQIGDKRTKPGDEYPCITELIKNVSDSNKKLIGTINLFQDSLTLMAPPGTPKDRVKFLGDAFAKVFSDKEFVAAVTKATGTEITPSITGDELANRAKGMIAIKADVKVYNDLIKKYVK